LSIDDFLSKSFMLQQLEEVQADWVFDVSDVLGAPPVLQVGEVVDEIARALLEEAPLSQEVQIVGVSQALNELQLNLERDHDEDDHDESECCFQYLKSESLLLLRLVEHVDSSVLAHGRRVRRRRMEAVHRPTGWTQRVVRMVHGRGSWQRRAAKAARRVVAGRADDHGVAAGAATGRAGSGRRARMRRGRRVARVGRRRQAAAGKHDDVKDAQRGRTISDYNFCSCHFVRFERFAK